MKKFLLGILSIVLIVAMVLHPAHTYESKAFTEEEAEWIAEARSVLYEMLEEKEIRALRKDYNVYSVRPGITGWAQINGRDSLTIEEKALFDKEYIDKQSILFDIKILFRTVLVVLKRENIAEGGEAENKRKP